MPPTGSVHLTLAVLALVGHAYMLLGLMGACLPDPDGGRTAERVAAWRGNWKEALLCGCAPYPSCSRSSALMIDRHRACV
jgi:hypothetical protein